MKDSESFSNEIVTIAAKQPKIADKNCKFFWVNIWHFLYVLRSQDNTILSKVRINDRVLSFFVNP